MNAEKSWLLVTLESINEHALSGVVQDVTSTWRPQKKKPESSSRMQRVLMLQMSTNNKHSKRRYQETR
jgi:hypothetical protein